MTEKRSIQPEISLLHSDDWQDYELLDCGNGRKLERYGDYLLARPETEAVWSPALPEKEWKKAAANFMPSAEENGGHWVAQRPLPDYWALTYKGLHFTVQTTASRHLGVFPEQANHWDWIGAQIKAAHRPLKVLNLFGYTGMASLAAAQAGAAVTHVDASRKVVNWARDNQALSGLSDRPIRWIIDDAVKFVQRESRRGAGYDGIILDPPKFGRGPKGEVWEFYKFLPELLKGCQQILSPDPVFMVLTAYAVKASSITMHFAMQEILQKYDGSLESGEIVLDEKSAGRILSTAVFARWSRFTNKLPNERVSHGKHQ